MNSSYASRFLGGLFVDQSAGVLKGAYNKFVDVSSDIQVSDLLMNLVASCKDNLSHFRIKELKDVLAQLGLSKQGKKQDLVERILSALSDGEGLSMTRNGMGRDEVAKLVDDTYMEMEVSRATELKLKEKIRCPCGSTLPNDSMMKCEDSMCGVWQHITCVIIPEKPNEGAPPVPADAFYCELCRLTRADPFWVTVTHPLFPAKLVITSVPADGSNPVQSVEKTFQLTRANADLMSKQDFDIQAWCMLLNDKVPYRLQWPQYADLQVNGVPLQTVNRPGSQLLSANGRDDGAIITACTRAGINKISLTGCDARIFCFGVRLVKRRTVQQILNLIPKESEGEPFEEALARVRRCVGGGTPTENADSDSDLEVVDDFIPVSLRCPMSGSRMKVAGRFKACAHMGCFDLEVFVEMNERSRKWQCPVCLKNYGLGNAIIDPYFNGITSKLRNCSQDVIEVEVKRDGSWRAKTQQGDRRGGLGDVGLWHAADGSVCAHNFEQNVVPISTSSNTESEDATTSMISSGSNTDKEESEDATSMSSEDATSEEEDDSPSLTMHHSYPAPPPGIDLILLSDSDEEN